MSEFTTHKAERTEQLVELFLLVTDGKPDGEQLKRFQPVIDRVRPEDVVAAVDRLMLLQIPMPRLKKGINKTLNLLNRALKEFPFREPAPESFLGVMMRNNSQVDRMLKDVRPLLKELNSETSDPEMRRQLKQKLVNLSKIDLYYQIKENVLFPLIERYLPDYRCLQVMWSFHDDIRRNLKEAIALLGQEPFDLKELNRLSGDLFFNIYAIRFREERILFPVIMQVIPEAELDRLLADTLEIGFPFANPENVTVPGEEAETIQAGRVELGTGALSPEQLMLMLNHLPVDITFVDENNRVCYFSAPKKRIFRRTNSIIGRDVKNCHPHESVHVVEQIVEAFRNGEKNEASFWIRMKSEFVLIQYFAVRDEHGAYKGVIEVSQEVSSIRELQGEKRLLDWQ